MTVLYLLLSPILRPDEQEQGNRVNYGEEYDLTVYMDGIDVKDVAAAARRLDATSFFRNQMSHEKFQKSIQRTDEELFAEREKFRIQEEKERKELAVQKLLAIRDSWGQ